MSKPKFLRRSILPVVVGIAAMAAAPISWADDLPTGLVLKHDYLGNEVYEASYDYYKQFTYDWTDVKGVKHTSNITERAQSGEQIAALLKEIYTNPRIPGYFKDISCDERMKDHLEGWDTWANEQGTAKYNTTEYETDADGNKIQDADKDGNLRWYTDADGNKLECWKVKTEERPTSRYGLVGDKTVWSDIPYPACNVFPYYIATAPQKPIYNGATALVVQLKDDYKKVDDRPLCGYFSADNNPWEKAFEFIESVQLITDQFYLEEHDVYTKNPGFLFSVEAGLSKCFIITKGSPRPYKANYQLADGTYSKATGATITEGYPFYGMFEEFSPTNSGPMYNAYREMNDGERFSVDHNCSSIVEQQHDIIFGSEANQDRTYPVNLRFFLPDYRFAGQTTTNPAGSSYNIYTYYAENYQPYIFFNKINAEIDGEVIPYSEDPSKVLVPVKWFSRYKHITDNYGAQEAFFIYRTKGGIVDPNPIPGNQILLRTVVDGEDKEFSAEDDNGVTHTWKYSDVSLDVNYPNNTNEIGAQNQYARFLNHASQYNYIYVIEDKENRASSEVEYLIYGRRADSGFALVESNIVKAEIAENTAGIFLDLKKAYARNFFSHKESTTLGRQNINDYANIISIETIDGHDGILVSDLEWTKTWPYYPTSTLELWRTGNDTYAVNNPGYTPDAVKIGDIKIVDTDVAEGKFSTDVMAYIWGANKTFCEADYTNYVYIYRFNIIAPEKDANGNEVILGYMFYKMDAKWIRDYILNGTTSAAGVDYKLAVIANSTQNPYHANCTATHPWYSGDISYGQKAAPYYNAKFADTATTGNCSYIGRFKDSHRASTLNGDHSDSYSYQIKLTNPAGEEKESNKCVVYLPKRPLYVGYIPYTREQIEADQDYHGERLAPNSKGLAFEIKNNVNIAGYDIYRLRRARDGAVADDGVVKIAHAERLTSGAFEKFSLTEDGKDYFLGSTETQYRGKLPIEFLSEITPEDAFTIDIRYLGDDIALESNPYNYDNASGNSYGGRITQLVTLPQPVIENVTIKRNCCDKVTNHGGDNHKFDCSVVVDAEDLDFFHFEGQWLKYNVAGYGLWSHVHSNYHLGDGAYPDDAVFFGRGHINDGSTPAPISTLADEDDSHDVSDVNSDKKEYNYSFEHQNAGGLTQPVAVTHVVRLYAQAPAESLIAPSDMTEGYVVTDTDGLHGLAYSNSVTTGVDDVVTDSDVNDSEEYYNLQGMRIDADNLTPGLYLMHKGKTTVKVYVK